jgi:hypothetical protein
MKLLIVTLLLLQFGPRAPLTPAETLLEPAMLRAIDEAGAVPGLVSAIAGSDAAAGEILIHCVQGNQCGTAMMAARKLQSLVNYKRIPPPSRGIKVAETLAVSSTPHTRAILHVAKSHSRTMQVVRSLWSTASITDEVVEVFASQAPYGTAPGSVTVRPFENVGQPPSGAYGIPATSVVAADGDDGDRQAAFVVAASAYFLATLPNAGSEALLSHLTVGAHARLAEDGRKAMAQMGSQQRASGEVLMMFALAIDREQRRIRSFERYMPAPVDPILHDRILDMEKSITGVWASMGLTPSPFVPPAERIRGRGGEDRRVPAKTRPGPLPAPDPPAAMLKFTNLDDILAELGNLIDDKRSVSDIRDMLSAEFGAQSLPVVSDYFDRLAKAGAVSIR